MAASTGAENAQGAQIPLESFRIPDFPANARSLKALTLTSSIRPERYRAELDKPIEVPKTIPIGIESLTLELFSLGYPTDFLIQLAARLPNLKSLVIYSQLLSGLTDESLENAVHFFKRLPNIRALHLLDVFARPGLFKNAAPWLKYNTSDVPGEARRGLMFLEVNFTFDNTDHDFMSKIAASELPALVGPGLISCSFNIALPEPDGQPTEDQGIMAFNKTIAKDLVEALTDEDTYPRGLRALNTTLYTLTVDDLERILKRHKHLLMLNATIEIEPGHSFKQKLIKTLQSCEHLEQVEIVAHPTIDFFMELTRSNPAVFTESLPTSADMQTLGQQLTKLKSFTASILRSSAFGKIDLLQENGQWTTKA